MLSSITPLGQRGRGMSWTRTVVAFWVGAIGAGVVVFGSLGLLGESVGLGQLYPWGPIVIVGAAALLDLLRATPLGPRRQVDEDWLGRYRDWVVGLGFGAQLGAGFVTIIPSFGTWAIAVLAGVAGFPGALLIGAGFGLGRSALLVTSRQVNSPSALAESMLRFVSGESRARWASLAGYGSVVLIGSFYVA